MSKLTGKVEPGRIVKLCQIRDGRRECGRLGRTVDETGKFRCDRHPAEGAVELAQDGRSYRAVEAAKPPMIDVVAMVNAKLGVTNG